MSAQDRDNQYIPDHAEAEANDKAANKDDMPTDALVDERYVQQAEDAIEEMEARERRRDTTYRSGGDNLNPGIDTNINSNAPKDDELPNKKGGGSRGKSDWN